MTDLVKLDNDTINDMRVKAQNFAKLTHKEPSENEVQINKHAGNAKYLPISFLEMQLDEMFFGLWQTSKFETHVVANEIIGSLELEYFHPTFHTWIKRVGAGAVMIQQHKNSEVTDINKKIKNTLTKDYPHLKAECFRNACLSIGKSFGRDLNREFTDSYNPIIKEQKDPKIGEYLNKLMIALDEYTGDNKEALKAECSKAVYKDQFTIEFAQGIAKKIGIEL